MSWISCAVKFENQSRTFQSRRWLTIIVSFHIFLQLFQNLLNLMTVLHLVINDLGRLSSAVYFISFILICSHFIVLFFINNSLLFLHYSSDLHTIFLVEWLWFFFRHALLFTSYLLFGSVKNHMTFQWDRKCQILCFCHRNWQVASQTVKKSKCLPRRLMLCQSR